MINCRAGGQPSPQIRWRKLTTPTAGPSTVATTLPITANPMQLTKQIVSLNNNNNAFEQDFGLKQADFRIITSNSHIQILENGSMIIKDVEQNDATKYICQAFNGINPSLSEMIELKVQSK